jgi:subtilisin family serine protease
MDNEKLENLLNLALDATEEERKKSLVLDVGYETSENSWEVIVKYTGTEARLRMILSERFGEGIAGKIQLANLSNEYAILVVPEQLVEQVAALDEIEYMEKPKRLFFAVNNGKRASCISELQMGGQTSRKREDDADFRFKESENVSLDAGMDHLTGKGVLVGIVDSGIDYSHPDFRNPDGTTRILALWDQTLSADGSNTQEEFTKGVKFERETINLALEQPTERERYAICPSRDLSGHGTHVAGIAAGNGRASGGQYRGVAYESELLVVKLGNPREGGFPRTTELMLAVDYCIAKAQEYGRPLALNLSFGNNYGAHSGTSLLETFLDDMARRWRCSIIVGSGNEGAGAGHTAGKVKEGQSEQIELAVSLYETSLNLQIWKNYADEMAVELISPGGQKTGAILKTQGAQRFYLEQTEILMYYGQPSPYSPFQEIYFDFLPQKEYIDAGIWEIRLLPQRIVLGEYNMWLPSGGVLNAGTGFLRPVEETTLTIPSTAGGVITVGAYDAYFDQPAAFSGRGYTRETKQVKPDLAAPGVDITSCAPGGGYAVRTGTSMATPFVTGSAALLMQWGIVNGNDRYLYGEKMKAYLQSGARHLNVRGVAETYPNPQLGWGTLCVKESLPTEK